MTDNIQSTKYHQEGIDAAWARKDPASCPYTTDEKKRTWWYLGFDAAKSTLFRLGEIRMKPKDIWWVKQYPKHKGINHMLEFLESWQ